MQLNDSQFHAYFTAVLSRLERIGDALEVIARGVAPSEIASVLNQPQLLSEKRRMAGQLGAAAVKRSASGKFEPANTGKKTGKGEPSKAGKSPANLRFEPAKISASVLDKPQVWERYRAAYLKRWHVEPLRNAKVNSQILALIRQLGAEGAERLVEYFLSRSDTAYVHAKHPIGMCLLYVQKLSTEMATGKEMTVSTARKAELEDRNQKEVREYLSKEAANEAEVP